MVCETCGMPLMRAIQAGKRFDVCLRYAHMTEVAEPAAENFREAARRDGCAQYLWAQLLAEYGVKYCRTDKGRYMINFRSRELPEMPLRERELYANCATRPPRRVRKRCGPISARPEGVLRPAHALWQDTDRGLRGLHLQRPAQRR